jgi:hypothetical protein
MHWKLKLYIAVIIWFAIGEGLIYWYLHRPPRRLTNISQITSVVPMKFPKSAQVLDGETVFGPSALYFIAKIKIPRSDFHRFLAQPLLNDGKGLSNDEADIAEGSYPPFAEHGWKIDSIKKYLAGYLPAEANASFLIKIDLDHRDYVIVYLFYLN